MTKHIITYYTKFAKVGWQVSGYQCSQCNKYVGKTSKVGIENHVCKKTKYKKKGKKNADT